MSRIFKSQKILRTRLAIQYCDSKGLLIHMIMRLLVPVHNKLTSKFAQDLRDRRSRQICPPVAPIRGDSCVSRLHCGLHAHCARLLHQNLASPSNPNRQRQMILRALGVLFALILTTICRRMPCSGHFLYGIISTAIKGSQRWLATQ